MTPDTRPDLSCVDCNPLDTQGAAPLAASYTGPLAFADARVRVSALDGVTSSVGRDAGDYPLFAILGPTASGKSALAIFLAERLDGEVINYDSVQLYRGLEIGSGKVSREDRGLVPHHLLDVADPDQLVTAGAYRRLALPVLAEVRGRRKVPILAGGTGLYLRALLEGLFEGPQRSEPLRARLRAIEQRRGRRFLHRLLGRLDPAAARIHPHDAQKMIRALEVRILAGEAISALQRRGRPALVGFRVVKIGLKPPREDLRRRIDRRVEAMFASGLVEETRTALGWASAAEPCFRTALGYRQACAVIDGGLKEDEAVRLAQAATRRYAKRQMTWFRREANVRWFEGFGDDPVVQQHVLQTLCATAGGACPVAQDVRHPECGEESL